MEDVWGDYDPVTDALISKGMIVARGYGMTQAEYDAHPKRESFYPRICPIWHDELPYKSVTVICTMKEMGEVQDWLGYVHGGDCSAVKPLEDGMVALRSDYQCW